MMDPGLLHGKNRLIAAMLWLVVAGYVLFIAWSHVEGYHAAARGEMPLYTDYTPTYAASMLVREIPAEYLYVQRTMAEAGQLAARAMYGDISEKQAHGVGFAPFMYPPTFILLLAPLAYLPYLLSYFIWLGVTFIPYMVAMRRILNGVALPFALAAPPVFFNAMYGQTGFLTGGLIGLGLALLAERPVWAGILIGLASIKPHFGILIPFALMAGGYWKTFGVAAATVIATMIASLFAFGDTPWFAFIGTTLFHMEGFAVGAYNFAAMTTVLATLRMAGVESAHAWAVQMVFAVSMALLTIWTWRCGRRHPGTLGLQSAILCLATLLAVPMAYLYDLVLLVPATGWLWLDMRQRGSRYWEFILLVTTVSAILAIKEIAERSGLQIGALLIVALLGLSLHRYRGALAASLPPEHS